MAKAFFSQKIRNSKNEIISGKFGLKYKLPNLKETIAFSIFTDGIYEEENIRFIIQHLPLNSVLLDLGANIGSICLPIAKLRPDVRIIAVEASPRVFSYLKENIEMNKVTNIDIVNIALSDNDGETISFYSPEEKFGKGSMSPVFTDKAETVKTITVDTLLKNKNISNVGFIKIDVEGYESFVFRGSEKLLSGDSKPPVLFEFADWAERQAHGAQVGDAQKELLRHGYQLAILDKPPVFKAVESYLQAGAFMMYAFKK